MSEILYVVLRRLNLAWQPIFFKLKKLGTAQFENLLVLGTAFATMGAFYKARIRLEHVCLHSCADAYVPAGERCLVPSRQRDWW